MGFGDGWFEWICEVGKYTAGGALRGWRLGPGKEVCGWKCVNAENGRG